MTQGKCFFVFVFFPTILFCAPSCLFLLVRSAQISSGSHGALVMRQWALMDVCSRQRNRWFQQLRENTRKQGRIPEIVPCNETEGRGQECQLLGLSIVLELRQHQTKIHILYDTYIHTYTYTYKYIYIYHLVVFLAVQIPPCRLSVLNPLLQARDSGFCSFLTSHCSAVTFVTLFLLPPSLNPPLLHLSMHREIFILRPILAAPELSGGTDMPPPAYPHPFYLKQEEKPIWVLLSVFYLSFWP